MFSSCCWMKTAFFFVACLLASCASLPSNARDPLVGQWRYADNVQSCRYHFREDGHFSGEVRVRAKLVSKFTGTWTVQGDRLLYSYASDELGRIPAGATDQDRLLKVDGDSFLIEAADGSKRRYARVR